MPDPRPHELLAIPNDHFDGGRNQSAEGEEPIDKGLAAMVRTCVERAPILEVTADYTLLAADEGKIIEVNAAGATTITLPAGLPIGYFVQVRQVGAGTPTIAAGAGATLNVVASVTAPYTIAEQWAAAAVEVRAANTWLASGQLA